MPKKAKQHSGSALDVGGVNLTEVERLLAFMQTHGLEEFEYQVGSLHIRLKKSSGHSAHSGAAATHHAAAPQPLAAPAAPAAPVSGSHEPPLVEDLHIVKSPIV